MLNEPVSVLISIDWETRNIKTAFYCGEAEQHAAKIDHLSSVELNKKRSFFLLENDAAAELAFDHTK